MAELPLLEDEAARYVLGQMGTAERRAFEARMEQSADLLALVRDVEAGSVALAMALPQREPPPQVWERIENEVQQSRTTRALGKSVRRQSGWWAAAACLVGWALYAFWVHRSDSHVRPPLVRSEDSPTEAISPEPSRTEPLWAISQPAATNLAGPLAPPPRGSSLARTGEIAALRREVQDLENQLTQLSQVLTQQQAHLSESGRFTILRTARPSSADATGQAAPTPSPEVQRAMLIVLARELGWLKPSTIGGEKKVSVLGGDLNVNFVDAQPASNPAQPQQPVTQPTEPETPTNLLAQTQSDPEPAATDLSGEIQPILTSSNLVLVVGSAAVPAATPVTIWSGTLPLATFIMGDRTTIASLAWTSWSGGSMLGITSGLPPGNMTFNSILPGSVLGQFYVPVTSPQP